MLRLNKQLSCLCRADSRDERSKDVCSKSTLLSTANSCSLPGEDEPVKRRLALCWTMSGMPNALRMVYRDFSFREWSNVEAVLSEKA